MPEQDHSISLNKFISQTGRCSRREADRWIEAGRVKINGSTAKKGNRVMQGDRVSVDGVPIVNSNDTVYIKLYKPPGITSTTDTKDKSNIIDFVNHPKRIFPIGRLDKPSTGLILLTNDGDIVNDVLRVEHGHEKEYIVTVNKPIDSTFVKKMSNGLPILNQWTKPCKVEPLGPSRFKIILTQGLNRQIRRMCEYLGYRVKYLKRVRIMHITLAGLKEGQWAPLNDKELKCLLSVKTNSNRH